MLLTIDIGNTSIVLGLFERAKLVSRLRIVSDTKRGAGWYAQRILKLKGSRKDNIEAAVISSVVPKLNNVVKKAVKKTYKCMAIIVSWKGIKGLKIALSKKHQVGVDRLVNALAAYRLYGGKAVIIDFGTATTFCAVDRKGRYLGGAITSGLESSRDILYRKTAKLPLISFKKIGKVIGKDTVSAMRSGLFFGYIDLVEGMIKRFKKELGSGAKVVATGGLAPLIAKGTKMIDVVDPDLTLKGLKLVYEGMNK
ncbi:type III pantothenate kinase [Candidatus Margulisiibacteriota bacterium]